MSKSKLYRIFIEVIVLIIIMSALIFFVGFRVTKVQIEGNKYYSDKEIKNMVLDAPNAKNSILVMLTKTEEKTKNAQMIDGVSIKRKNRNTIVVQVKEKQMVGCLEFQEKYVNFDRQGIIQIITEQPLDGVPVIDGISVKQVKQGEKLKGINTKKLNTILSVGKMLEKSEQKPDRLVFNDMNQMVLYYDDVEVRLGDDENMDEKMNRLSGILPQLKGMEGILHLENITEETTSVVFDNVGDLEEELDAPQESEDEKRTDYILKEEEGFEPEEKPESSKKEEKEWDISGLEYSDGTDAAESDTNTSK